LLTHPSRKKKHTARVGLSALDNLAAFQLRSRSFGNKDTPFARTGENIYFSCQTDRQLQPNVCFLLSHIPFIGSRIPP
jgi:hypothetical protein